jgi:hypothetical protein
MDSGRFGPPVDSNRSGDDSFGYFGGGAAASAPAPAQQAFGTPVQSPPAYDGGMQAPSPFGGPAGPPAYATYAPPPAPTRSRRGVFVAVAVVVAVLVGGFLAWGAYQRSRPVVLPTTFAGVPQNVSPAAVTSRDSILTAMKARNQGIQMDAGIYGTGTDTVVLAAARGHEDVSADLQGAGLKPATQIGADTCAQSVDGSSVSCVRSGSGLTVVVVAFGRTPEATAALVDQAWPLF